MTNILHAAVPLWQLFLVVTLYTLYKQLLKALLKVTLRYLQSKRVARASLACNNNEHQLQEKPVNMHLLDKQGNVAHDFDVTGELQTLQRSSSASTAVILYQEKHYVFSYTIAGGGAIAFTEAELVEIVAMMGART